MEEGDLYDDMPELVEIRYCPINEGDEIDHPVHEHARRTMNLELYNDPEWVENELKKLQVWGLDQQIF
ncbi:hypothetical protein KAU11_11505 [Candidatus Babeliales bacterium]|nr:hypothetical protein [Candidatus Babeliales bacterium]